MVRCGPKNRRQTNFSSIETRCGTQNLYHSRLNREVGGGLRDHLNQNFNSNFFLLKGSGSQYTSIYTNFKSLTNLKIIFYLLWV